MRKLLLSLVMFSSIISGTVGTAVASDDSALKIVQAVDARWNATFNRGDSKALAWLYTKKATLSPGNGKVLKGQEQIANLFKSFIDNGVHNHSIKVIDVYRDHKQIVQLARWQAEAVNNKQKAITIGGILMTVIEQSAEGKWLTRSQIWNMKN